MQLLEAWATMRLEALSVDGVFAPYIVGMLRGSGDDGAPAEDREDIKFNIHQVLMGWLSIEDEDKAEEFVDDLMKYDANPLLLSDIWSPAPATRSAVLDINDIIAQDEELKASAPTFVPGALLPADPQALDDGAYDKILDNELAFDGAEHESGFGDQDQEAPDAEDEVDEALQDEDSFFWSVAYDLVDHLQLKFPDIDPTRLCDLLRLVGLDNDKAHAVLKATLERESIGTGQVCRHYLAGECRRADCMFIHDTDMITCRFWLRGSCLQAEHCVFAHDFCEYYSLDENELMKRDYDSEDEMDDGNDGVLDFEAEDMFPSLGSAAPAADSSSQEDRSNSSLSMDFARAVSLQPVEVPVDNPYAPPSRRAPPAPQRPLYHKTSMEFKWVDTGAAVASQYLELREQAYQMACARNKCLMGATQAYRSGNPALAKRLSNQGHEYNAKMKNYHFLAASQIFEARNPPSQLYTDRLMDLHGLHVAEAVEFLAQMLPKLADEGLDTIYLVTGSGHHSKGPQSNARLLPAVERFLATDGYQFSPVADGRGYVGMLMVDLSW